METTHPTISLLLPHQLDAAIELFLAQLEEHHLPTDPEGIRSVVKELLADNRRGFILAANAPQGPLIGIALACSYLGVEHGGPSGWLEELYVTPSSRGHGLGSKLIAEVIRQARARHWRALDLEVTDDHQRVISLYQRHGFQPHTRTRFFLKL